jgi:hypothetical protein
MKAQFTYNLPEEREEFELHMQASSFHAAVYEYDQWLRGICKHRDPKEFDAEACRDKLWENLREYGVTIK